jgi:hypothetical protein
MSAILHNWLHALKTPAKSVNLAIKLEIGKLILSAKLRSTPFY